MYLDKSDITKRPRNPNEQSRMDNPVTDNTVMSDTMLYQSSNYISYSCSLHCYVVVIVW